MGNTLIVIDLQKGFVKPQSDHILPVIDRILRHNSFGLILQTKYVNPKGSTLERNLGWTALRSSDDEEFVFDIKGAKIFSRSRYSAVDDKMLKLLKPTDRIYLCGLETDACVLATAFSLFDAGLKVHIIEDATATNAKFGEEPALDIIKRNFGKECLVDSEHLLFK
jgi:nicotinamidase-related amidase